MPRRVIKQPNGKLALFSSVVDHFIMYDATVEEMRAFLLEEELEEAKRRVDEAIQHGVDDWPPYKQGVKGSGRDRWDHDANTMLWVHHGDENERAKVVNILRECGMAQEEIDAWEAEIIVEEAVETD